MGLPLEPTTDDILLVTDFGRSAQGWLSYMLCYLLNARYIEPYNLLAGKKFTGSRVIESNTRGELPGRARTPYSMVVKTHGYPAKDRFDLTRSIVYLTRDPRDVSVSYYYLALNWRKAGSRSLGSFIHATPVICHLYVAWQWRRHFDRWSDCDAFRVRYEDLRRDTEGTLTGLLQHFGVSADPVLIREAVALFSFENTYGRKRGQEDRNNPEARKGQIGDYRNHFAPWLNRLFWMICGKQAELAGYRLDGSTTTEPPSDR